MTPRVAVALGILASALVATGLILLFFDPIPIDEGDRPWIITQTCIAISYSIVGAFVAAKRPGNSVGWLLLLIGLGSSTILVGGEYVVRGLVVSPGSLPVALVVAWAADPLAVLVYPAAIFLILTLFPTGRPASRLWWSGVWSSVGLGVLTALDALLTPGSLIVLLRSNVHLQVHNPTGSPVSPLLHQLLNAPSPFLSARSIPFVIGLAAVLVRWRRARGEERQQLKWFAAVPALFVLTVVLAFLLGPSSGWAGTLGTVLLVLPLSVGLPAAVALAILKYRLYDIDIVINKSFVFAAMAAFITAIYVGIVVGIGTVVGTGARPNLALSILATAIVAVAFQPVRERVQRLANRLVYGKRATPYEVLSRFSHRVAGVYSSEEVLPQMARVLTEGTGAARADVWMRLGDEIAPAASWPSSEGSAPSRLPINGHLLPPVPAVSRIVPVRHQGELLGALSINKRPAEVLTPVEDKLLADLAAQAGLVLHNVRLTAELRARLTEISQQAVELRASRQRIVAAQDAERSRLERNIHDGAQQNLVALTVKLRLASTLVKRSPERARTMLAELKNETRTARTTLADLARGIYPQQLREQGLVEALKPYGPVEARGIGRYELDAETAVYFSCLEALQNAAKHARASRVRILLSQEESALTFAVIDDGVGFDRTTTVYGAGLQNMMDRLEAVGGRLDIIATPGKGTTVTGHLTVRVLEPMA